MNSKCAVVALTLSLLAILSAASASASVRADKPPTPDQVRAAFDANKRAPAVVEFRRVTLQEATTKAFPNGRMGDVEKAAAPAPTSSVQTTSSEGAAGGNACWYVSLANGMGTFPYERTHHAATYWCAVYAQYLTYRRTDTRGSPNGFCSSTGTGSWKMGGGVYYRWVKVHTWSSFACPTPWWWTLNDTLWMNIAYNVWGNYAVEERHP